MGSTTTVTPTRCIARRRSFNASTTKPGKAAITTQCGRKSRKPASAALTAFRLRMWTPTPPNPVVTVGTAATAVPVIPVVETNLWFHYSIVACHCVPGAYHVAEPLALLRSAESVPL